MWRSAFLTDSQWLLSEMKLIRISQRMQRYLKEYNVPHILNVDSHGHNPVHWRNNLDHFKTPSDNTVERAGGEQGKQWAAEMIRADAVGFICDRQLGNLTRVKS